MNTPTRLGLYGLGLVAVFGVAAVTANALIPDETVQNWAQDTESHDHSGDDVMDHSDSDTQSTLGLGMQAGAYRLDNVTAPAETDTDGTLSLTIRDAENAAVTDFHLTHEEPLHLIVVRTDGQHFRHVHPEMNEDGTWSTPWSWEEAGTYRVFADVAPADVDSTEPVTLSTLVQVSGEFAPNEASISTETTVDDFTVAVDGDLIAGEESHLTMTVTRDGRPVEELQPYLGAYGHLVALRSGDLAYLHVHPHGDAPEPGATSGPEIDFNVHVPTTGRYLLYLDFQVNNEVYSAPLVLDAHGSAAGTQAEPQEGNGHEHN